jgi:hypothetical protein
MAAPTVEFRQLSAQVSGPVHDDDTDARVALRKSLGGGPAYVIWGVTGLGILALLVFALTLDSATVHGWTAFGVGLGIICASAAVGTILGFLFGIPRALQVDRSGAPNGAGANYGPNTNLEQISDWLTKILVGVGLVQIGNIGGPGRRLVHAAGEALGDTASARALAAALILLFLVTGFLASYVVTRTWVTKTFQHSDLEIVAMQAAVIATGNVQDSLDQQATADARALALVDRQLDAPPGTPIPTQEQLNEAITAVSSTIRIQVFRRAREFRQKTWKGDKERMELAIPVFQALIASDRAGAFHRNHGQLGFALKDKRSPDWRAAEDALTVAITRRGSAEEGYLYYEFNRAVCRIQLDPAPAGPSSAEQRQRVMADVDVVRRNSVLVRNLLKEDAVRAWLERNDVTL